MPLRFCLATLLLLPACSSEDDAAASEQCTPYAAICVSSAVHICQPDGSLNFSFECSASQTCAEGKCVNGAVTDGGESTGGASGATGNTNLNAGGCDSDADISALAGDKFLELGAICIPACTGEEQNLLCLDSCLQEALTPTCGSCGASWLTCAAAACTSACAQSLDAACLDCAGPSCNDDLVTCAGLPLSDLLGAHGGGGDDTGDGGPGGATGGDGGGIDGNPNPPGWEAGKACSLDDYSAFTDGSYAAIKSGCADKCELDETREPFLACATECLTATFSAECAACGAAYQWCELECEDTCGNDLDSAACQACATETCLPPQIECSGVKLKLF